MRERMLGWTVNQKPVASVGRGVAAVFPSLMGDYVAGETDDDALAYVETELNPDGITGLVDLLGEHHTEREDVDDAYRTYTALIDEIADREIDAELSVKLTQLGLDLYTDSSSRKQACKEYVEPLAARSTEQGQRLWIDMEDTGYTDDTLDIYTDLLAEDHNVGLCLQAYLERTEDDIKSLPEEAAIRLVKGAYDRDREFSSWEVVDDNYEDLLEQLFHSGLYVAAGTHNERLLNKAEELAANTGTDAFEFQFLMGVRPERAQDLAADHDVAVYVPFGEEASAYFWRRVQEHPKYLEDVMRAEAEDTASTARDTARSIGARARSLLDR